MNIMNKVKKDSKKMSKDYKKPLKEADRMARNINQLIIEYCGDGVRSRTVTRLEDAMLAYRDAKDAWENT